LAVKERFGRALRWTFREPPAGPAAYLPGAVWRDCDRKTQVWSMQKSAAGRRRGSKIPRAVLGHRAGAIMTEAGALAKGGAQAGCAGRAAAAANGLLAARTVRR